MAIINGTIGNDSLTGTITSDFIYGFEGDDTLIGLEGNDILDGGDGKDYLDSGAGADTMAGGYGNDTYVVDSLADVILEDPYQGSSTYNLLNYYTDTVESSITYTLGANLENLTLTGTAAINGYGNELNNVLIGNSAANNLEGGAGLDSLYGGAGDDYLNGGDGGGTLDGGTGADIMVGGIGNDTYIVDNIGDVVAEYSAAVVLGSGDIVDSSVTFDLSVSSRTMYIENLTLTGTDEINGTGNGLNNHIIGNSAANILDGVANQIVGSGYTVNDILEGGLGNDTYIWGGRWGGAWDGAPLTVIIENLNAGTDTVQSSFTYILGDNLENLTLTGTAAISGTGNALNNVLTGNTAANVLTDGAGNDTLNGGLGADSMTGGLGNDTYVVDNIGDTVIENVDEGTDTIQSSIAYVLGANIENLTLTGTAAINGTGNTLNNVLTGNNAASTLEGGLGNDTYVVSHAGTSVIENANEGTDTVQSSVSYTLSDNVENLTLVGSGLVGTGNELNNTYTISDAGNAIVEAVGGGVDTILTNLLNYTLDANVENLTLTGTVASNGTGNALDNYIIGTTGTNILDGGAGADTLAGGSGTDTYVVDDAGDTVIENLNAGIDTIQSSISYTLVDNVENLTLTGTAAINATGNALNNTLIGNAAANILNGGGGYDRLEGGLGNDTYVVDYTNTTVIENVNAGIDTVLSSIANYTLSTNFDNLTLTGSAAINGTGNSLNNTLIGNAAANILNGSGGADTLEGGLGDDTYVVGSGDVVIENVDEGTDLINSSVTYTLGANVENLTLTGSSSINGTGNALDNTIIGNTGANILNGGGGADTLAGGQGNDTYVLGFAGDTVVVIENENEGTDTIQSSVSYTLGANFENLTLTGTAAISGAGNELNNVLTGNSAANVLTDGAGNDTLNGGLGADSMTGGLGNDTYVVDNIGDTVIENVDEGTDTIQSSITYTLGATLENLTLTGSSSINGTGNSFDNALTGNTGVNILDGGAGADTMAGGRGNDTYLVDDAGDTVIENLNDGTDTVKSSVTYTLGNNLENLTLTGTAAIDGTGNALNNVLTGNTGANVLAGGAGNDTYVVGSGDVVIENADEGTDTVQSSVTYTLGINVENLTLTGTAAISGFGNELDNVLTGNTGANVLAGGTGNDTYVVGSGDVVSENADEGTDLINSSVTYTLSANVENLTLTGSAAINGTGNALANSLIGNTGANILNGGIGADTLAGGTGNDTYVVDIDDMAIENLNAGTDTVQASFTYTLGANLENLTLTGTAAISGVGNELNNVLTGNTAANVLTDGAGNDTLNGGAGADTMTGGLGNDTYVVDNIGDSVIENVDEGTDIIQSSITYTLLDNVENLTLTGTAAINGTGNALNNVIIGTTAANSLSGGDGADTITGGNGADTITGGVGADVIYLTETTQAIDVVKINTGDSLATSIDQIYKFNATSTLNDKLDFASTAIAANGPADGIDVGSILSHSVTSGMISFIDVEVSIQLEGYPLPMIINATNLADANNYLATNITSGENVAFYVDANSNGLYTDTTDYLRVFQGGATAAGALSTDDIFVDIYTTSGLGGVTALALAAAANTVQIV